VGGFKYSTRKSDPLFEEWQISQLQKEANMEPGFSVEDLQRRHLSCWDTNNNEPLNRWTIYNCLNAEVDKNKRKYFLGNGKWFEVNTSFVQEVDQAFKRIRKNSIKLPDYNHNNENEYNKVVAQKLKGACLDAKNLVYGGNQSKIEFCDVLTKDRNLLYIKRYAGSSVLSHLFNQVVVSGDLLASDEKFRRKVKQQIIPQNLKSIIPLLKLEPRKYKIIYVIIGKSGRAANVNVPFFSKITLLYKVPHPIGSKREFTLEVRNCPFSRL
jgi:uncharacterized protein (TIGR04141 family)